jgi:hypothetical protein
MFENLKLGNFFFQKFVFHCHPEVTFFPFEILTLLPTSKASWIFIRPNFNKTYDFCLGSNQNLPKTRKLQNNFMNSYVVIIKIIYIQQAKIQGKEVIQLHNFNFPSETLVHRPKIIVFIEIGEYENSSSFRSW